MSKGSLSFPKSKRLTLPAEFARVKAEGETHRGRLLVLSVVKIDDEKLFRVGLVTSRRVGAAVVRNRIRRRLREIIRTHQSALRAGFWFVVIARANAAEAPYRQLLDEWLRLAERASILAP